MIHKWTSATVGDMMSKRWASGDEAERAMQADLTRWKAEERTEHLPYDPGPQDPDWNEPSPHERDYDDHSMCGQNTIPPREYAIHCAIETLCSLDVVQALIVLDALLATDCAFADQLVQLNILD